MNKKVIKSKERLSRIRQLINEIAKYDVGYAEYADSALSAAIKEGKFSALVELEILLKVSYFKLKLCEKKEDVKELIDKMKEDLIKFAKKWGIILLVGVMAVSALIGMKALANNYVSDNASDRSDKTALVEDYSPTETKGDKESIYNSFPDETTVAAIETPTTDETTTEVTTQETIETETIVEIEEELYLKDIKIEYQKDGLHLTSDCIKDLCEAAENEIQIFYTILDLESPIKKENLAAVLCIESAGVPTAVNKESPSHKGLFQSNCDAVQTGLDAYERLYTKALNAINQMEEGELKEQYIALLNNSYYILGEFAGKTAEEVHAQIKDPIISSFIAGGYYAEVSFKYYNTFKANEILIMMSGNAGAGRVYNLIKGGVIIIDEEDGSLLIDKVKLDAILDLDETKNGTKCRNGVVYAIFANALSNKFKNDYENVDIINVYEETRNEEILSLVNDQIDYYYPNESDFE